MQPANSNTMLSVHQRPGFCQIATTVDTNAHCNTIELERLETK